MSKEALTKLLDKALSDNAFAAKLRENFDTAIKGYDLTGQEIDALKKGDEGTLKAMGVDERLTKWGTGLGTGI